MGLCSMTMRRVLSPHARSKDALIIVSLREVLLLREKKQKKHIILEVKTSSLQTCETICIITKCASIYTISTSFMQLLMCVLSSCIGVYGKVLPM